MVRRLVGVVLQLAGGLCVILAMLAAAAPLASPVKHLPSGAMLLFRNVELLTMIAAGWGGLGVFLLWIGSRRFGR